MHKAKAERGSQRARPVKATKTFRIGVWGRIGPGTKPSDASQWPCRLVSMFLATVNAERIRPLDGCDEKESVDGKESGGIGKSRWEMGFRRRS